MFGSTLLRFEPLAVQVGSDLLLSASPSYGDMNATVRIVLQAVFVNNGVELRVLIGIWDSDLSSDRLYCHMRVGMDFYIAI